MTNNKQIILAIIIFLGLSIQGYYIGRSLQRFKKEDRSIHVKGFAEREVKANFAVWTIKTRITTNNVVEGSNQMEENKVKIKQFLTDNGLKLEEMIEQQVNVIDKLANDYGGMQMGQYRYIMENAIQVRSTAVDKVQQVSRMTDQLLKLGIVITAQNDYNPAVQYLFTDLNKIKPEMLAEATQNAKKAALEFTKESDVDLGNLKRANQGLFTIVDRDFANVTPGGEGGYYQPSVTDIFKKIRVVIHVEYAID